MKYTEIAQDLFELPTHYVLAHCIAADARMGTGIAVEFANRYRELRSMMQSLNLIVGEVILFSQNDSTHRFFNLITKTKSSGKPTRESFNKTILRLKDIAIEHEIKHIGMPLIGSGLDKLNWDESRKWIQEVFQDTDIEIVVCIKP